MTPFNLGEYHFVSLENAITAGMIILLALAIRVFIRGPNKSWRSQSSTNYFASVRKPAILRKSFWGLARLLFAAQVFFLLVALAEPTTRRAEKERIVVSRERVDLLDVSISMCFRHGASGKSAGAVARENYLKFLRRRRDKNDRVALFLFSTKTYRVQNFTTDGSLQRFSAFMAPQVLSGKTAAQTELFAESPYIACDTTRDVRWVDNEGGTELDSALNVVGAYFRNYGSKEIRNKALLLVTDAAVNRLPSAELEELERQGIRPYMIFLKPNRAAFEWMLMRNPGNNLLRSQLENPELMIKEFQKYGWKYYEVSDETALRLAYEDIDRLEGVRFREKATIYNESLARHPLFFAFYAGIAALIIGLLHEFGWGDM